MNRFLQKNEFDTSNVYLLKPVAYVDLAETSSKYFATWELFNHKGVLLVPRHDSVNSCISNIEYFIQYIENNSYKEDTIRNLQKDLFQQFTNTNILNNTKMEEQNYTLVLYWTVFMGKYSKDILSLEHFANLSESKISVIKVNMDLREDIDDFSINLKTK